MEHEAWSRDQGVKLTNQFCSQLLALSSLLDDH